MQEIKPINILVVLSRNGSGPSHSHNGHPAHHMGMSQWKITRVFSEHDDSALINRRLPKELLLRVFSYLDIISLCRSAQVTLLQLPCCSSKYCSDNLLQTLLSNTCLCQSPLHSKLIFYNYQL